MLPVDERMMPFVAQAKNICSADTFISIILILFCKFK